jgi:hypothetical protein
MMTDKTRVIEGTCEKVKGVVVVRDEELHLENIESLSSMLRLIYRVLSLTRMLSTLDLNWE